MSRTPVRAGCAAALALALPLALAAPAAAATRTPTPSGASHAVASHLPLTPAAGVRSDGTTSVVAPVDRSGRALSAGRAGSASTRQAGLYRSSSPLSTWQVTYTGSTSTAAQQAQAAFQRAVDTWSHTVYSPQPITVSVDLSDTTTTDSAGNPVLGGTQPLDYQDFPGAIAIPAALWNSRQTADAFPNREDIEGSFDVDPNIFYFGADPAGLATASCTVPPATTPTAGTCFDFETLVLGQLARGLGFQGSADASGSSATYGIDSQHTPTVFDYNTETSDGTAIVDYPLNSSELHNALVGNKLYWSGSLGASADHGRQPRLSAPSTWDFAASYGYLDRTSYPAGDPDSLATLRVQGGDAVRDPGELLLGMLRDLGWETPELPGGKFTPVTPTRVLDTGSTKVASGATRDIALGGHFGVPADATAVVLNVTSAVPSAADVVQVYPYPRDPASAPLPTSTNLHLAKGDNRANLVTVPLSQLGSPTGPGSGRVRLRNTGASTRLVADLAGYYSPAATTYFHAVSPTRLMDTRGGLGVPKRQVCRGCVVDLQITGKAGIPSTATAVTLTLTAVKPTAPTYVSAYPTGATKSTSSINLATGTIASNQVVVKIGSGGKVRFYNYNGSLDLVADLAGWYDTNASGGTTFRPTLPQPAYDDANGDDAPVIGAGGTDTFTLGDAGYGIPYGATAAVVNVTGLGSTAATYLTAYPAGTARPTASNVNLVKGQNAASLATVRLPLSGSDPGALSVYNQGGSVTTHVDVQGWFGP